MKTETILQALRAAIGAQPDNAQEIMTAIKALQMGSPIALKRARRALSNALSDGRADKLNEESRNLCFEVIDAIADDGGRMPDAGGKLAHIHLRMEPERKSVYVRAAQKRGESLSAWMTRICDEQAGF